MMMVMTLLTLMFMTKFDDDDNEFYNEKYLVTGNNHIDRAIPLPFFERHLSRCRPHDVMMV